MRATAIYGVAAVADTIGVFHLPSCHHLIASSFMTSQKCRNGRNTIKAIAAMILFCLVTHPVTWPSICSIAIHTNASDRQLAVGFCKDVTQRKFSSAKHSMDRRKGTDSAVTRSDQSVICIGSEIGDASS